MDAKQIIPILPLQAGRVVSELLPGLDGDPVAWACRLELEGADGILFRETGPGGPCRAHWIRAVAGALSVPFALEAPFLALAELGEALEAGVDRVVLTSGAAVGAASRTFGRVRVVARVHAYPSGSGWRVQGPGDEPEALAWMRELAHEGCGAILLSAPEACADLVQGAAGLPAPVLCLDPGGPEQALELLLHGAEGVAVPVSARSPRQWKSALEGHGLAFRD